MTLIIFCALAYAFGIIFEKDEPTKRACQVISVILGIVLQILVCAGFALAPCLK